MSGRHVFSSASPQDTRALGVSLGRLLSPGDFVGLIGALGAGKTLFVRGIADGAGVPPDEVASPTFAIVYPYSGRIPLYHADFYRLADQRELYATGFTDIGADGAVVVEWLDRVPTAAPPEFLRIDFVETGEDSRALEATAQGVRPRELLAGWVLGYSSPSVQR